MALHWVALALEGTLCGPVWAMPDFCALDKCASLTAAKSAVSANCHESLTAAQSAALSGKTRLKPASTACQFLHARQAATVASLQQLRVLYPPTC
ncbi:hypothetical protein C8R45DRAFT_327594 [Mycena sanguinolenta]|nr:hypothetical protein C8R45DRAFT_327594 [Mycena sanguinolenta]